MKTPFRIISAALLLLPALAPFVYLLAFLVQQQAVREKMEKELEQRPLITITIPPGEINWLRPGQEASINGHYFDVRSLTHNPDGGITLTGLYDTDETSLISQWQTDREAQEDPATGTEENAPLFQLYCEQLVTSDPCCFPIAAATIRYNNPAIPEIFRVILTPPPRC